ncbi:hypothetical protein [Acanthopleuribacter pedis]|uniref:Uncharacterized protein n=1 Tax=Acanthopleuribacter pedis TaxID=442870 RepID=A0A8J7U8S0_9BACT|nr:hypothetical protein [Acanthopleuribacter pedis]MBO1322866.1 hypothetical protein [Acanthopleuribacter pedis]
MNQAPTVPGSPDLHNLLQRALTLCGLLILPLCFADLLLNGTPNQILRGDRLLGLGSTLTTWVVLRLSLPRTSKTAGFLRHAVATLCLWNLGLFLLPGESTWFYVLVTPACVFLLLSERHSKVAASQGDRFAAVAVFAWVLAVFAADAVCRLWLGARFIKASPFAHDTPVVLLCGLGLLRLAGRLGRVGVARISHEDSSREAESLVSTKITTKRKRSGADLRRSSATSSIARQSKADGRPPRNRMGFMLRSRIPCEKCGLALLGSALVGLAALLTAVSLSGGVLSAPITTLLVVVILHALTAPLLWPETPPSWFTRFTHLNHNEAIRFRGLLYGLLNTVLQSAAVLILVKGAPDPLNAPILVLIAVGWLHAYRHLSLAAAVSQTALFLFPAGLWLFPTIPITLLFLAWCVLLGTCLAVRRHPRPEIRRRLVNPVISLVFTTAFIHLTVTSFPSPTALWIGAVFGMMWLALPERPFATIPLRFSLQSWTLITWFAVSCLFRGFNADQLMPWSMALALPLLLLLVPAPPRFAALGAEAGRAGFGLAATALLIAAAAFVLQPHRFEARLLPLLLLLTVPAIAVAFFLGRAMEEQGRWQRAAAWATEISLWLLFGAVRRYLDVQQLLALGTPLDAYLLLGIGAVAAGIREVLQRQKHALRGTLQRAAHLYALLGWVVVMWMGFTQDAWHHGAMVSLLLAGMYFAYARTQHRRLILAAAGFANLGLGIFLSNQGMHHALFFVVPAAVTVLALTQVLRDELDENQVKLIRLITCLVLLCTSAFFNLIDFRDSPWFPVSAAIIAALGVVAGISLRIRIYLYLGVGFFMLNIVTTLVHMVMLQPPDAVKLAVGMVFLGLGCLFTGSFLLFQMKRRELLRRYQALRLELSGWE